MSGTIVTGGAAAAVGNASVLPCGLARARPTDCNAPLSLRRNTVWTAAGNAAYAGSQWLQVAIIAHAGPARDVGRYALALGLCAPVFMLANLQLRPIQATDSLRRYTFGDYLGLRLATSSGALAVVLILACVFAGSIQSALLVLTVGVFKSIESVSDIYQGLFQQRQCMDRSGFSLLLKSSLAVPAFGILYYHSASLLCAAAGVALVNLTTLLTYDMQASRRIKDGSDGHGMRATFRMLEQPQFRVATLRKLAKRALPLGITMMLVSLNANAPRFVVEKYAGASGLGIFAAIVYLSMAGAMVVNAIGTAALPRLAESAAQNDDHEFVRTLSKLVAIAAALGIAGLAASIWRGRDLIALVYGAEYAKQSNILVLSMAAAAFSYVASMFGYAATALGRFGGQAWVLSLTVLTMLGLSMFLVPTSGLRGAALATVVSSATSMGAMIALVCWRTNDKS